MSRYTCVFDCETIPDVGALAKTLPDEMIKAATLKDGKIDAKTLSLLAFEQQKQSSGYSFLPVLYHKVVCISAVLLENDKFVKVNTIEGKDEHEIIANFLNFIENHAPRLVSYNGRGFDLPMLMIRAMKYNLQASRYYNTNDKWCNYRSRYDGVWAMDLLDHISDFRAVSGLKLDTLCAMLGMPGKYDVHGDQVLELFYANKLEKIKEYCESDTLNTYWLFLKYELLRGKINHEQYFSSLEGMSEFIASNKAKMSYTKPFCECIEKEIKDFGYQKNELKAEPKNQPKQDINNEFFDDFIPENDESKISIDDVFKMIDEIQKDKND